MTSILTGVVASGKSGHLSSPLTSAMEPLLTYSPAGQNAFSFTNIPQGYQHLQVRMSGGISSGPVGVLLKINGDTGGTDYSYHGMVGNGSTATGENSTSQPYGQNILYWNSSSAGIVDFLDYTSTVKNKVTRGIFGWDSNGSGFIIQGSDMWFPTTPAPITSLTFQIGNGSYTFTTGTQFTLYGVK